MKGGDDLVQRNNHKTMRITDEALEYIETFAGSTFNDKINNMIDYFINTQKTFEADLRFQEDKIKEKKALLSKLKQESTEIQSLIYSLYSKYNDLLR